MGSSPIGDTIRSVGREVRRRSAKPLTQVQILYRPQIRVCSSVGRALVSKTSCRWFEPIQACNWERRIAAIAADCKSALFRVHRFESYRSHNKLSFGVTAARLVLVQKFEVRILEGQQWFHSLIG